MPWSTFSRFGFRGFEVGTDRRRYGYELGLGMIACDIVIKSMGTKKMDDHSNI